MVVNYIFKNTYFIRVEATVNPNNVNSYRLLESCSFFVGIEQKTRKSKLSSAYEEGTDRR